MVRDSHTKCECIMLCECAVGATVSGSMTHTFQGNPALFVCVVDPGFAWLQTETLLPCF